MKNYKYLYYIKVYPIYRVKHVCVLTNTVLVNQIFGCSIQILISLKFNERVHRSYSI